MALPKGMKEREYNKFVEDLAGNVAVRVVATDASGADALKQEDSAHVSGDAGTPVWAVRNDTLAALVGTDGDYAPFQVDASGALYVNSKDGNASAPDGAYGIDAVGADTYTTVKTTTKACSHISISLGGSNDAVISIDGGTTDNIYMPANSIKVYDDYQIGSGVNIQAKNATPGSNYTNLTIEVW